MEPLLNRSKFAKMEQFCAHVQGNQDREMPLVPVLPYFRTRRTRGGSLIRRPEKEKSRPGGRDFTVHWKEIYLDQQLLTNH
jgi:hypothetical protein